MDFKFTDVIPFSRAEVFGAHRDHLAELANYLPNVESIQVESREEEGDVVKLVNIWRAAETEVPTVARAFIKPEMLRWIDRATWNEGQWRCQWELELGFLPDAISARGFNTFEEVDGKTEVTINGEIVIHANKIPGVPRLLAGKISSVVEGFVVKMIEPNLRQTNAGVASYLADKQAAAEE